MASITAKDFERLYVAVHEEYDPKYCETYIERSILLGSSFVKVSESFPDEIPNEFHECHDGTMFLWTNPAIVVPAIGSQARKLKGLKRENNQ